MEMVKGRDQNDKPLENQDSTSNLAKSWEKSWVNLTDFFNKISWYYNEPYQEWSTLIYVYNEYAFWRNAAELARKTKTLLLKTDDLEIEETTSMRGKFKAKLLEPHSGIEHIEFQIIKDRV